MVLQRAQPMAWQTMAWSTAGPMATVAAALDAASQANCDEVHGSAATLLAALQVVLQT